MEIFVDTPELLGGTQTHIGVLVTLLVLCLFHEKGNYMLSAITEIMGDFVNSIAKKVEGLRAEFTKKQNNSIADDVANDTSYWIKLAEEKHYSDIYDEMTELAEDSENVIGEFVNERKNLMVRFKDISSVMNLKKENEWASHAMLIILMLVFTLDAMGMSIAFGSMMLFFIMVLSAIYFIWIWYRYLKLRKPTNEYNTRGLFFLMAGIFALLILGEIGWFALGILSKLPAELYFLVTMLIFAIPMLIVGCSVSGDFSGSYRYNRKFFINHTVYIIAASILLTLPVYCSFRYNWLQSFSIAEEYVRNWKDNIQLFEQYHHQIRRCFVFVAAANAFFIPHFATYLYYESLTFVFRLKHINSRRRAESKIKKIREKFGFQVQKLQKRTKNEQS